MTYHIIARASGWVVKRSNSERGYRRLPSREMAIAVAKEIRLATRIVIGTSWRAAG